MTAETVLNRKSDDPMTPSTELTLDDLVHTDWVGTVAHDKGRRVTIDAVKPHRVRFVGEQDIRKGKGFIDSEDNV